MPSFPLRTAQRRLSREGSTPARMTAADIDDHPAGPDDELRRATQDLLADRWQSTSELLLTTPTYRHWTDRSQVLAVVAAQGTAVLNWLAEEPQNPAAIMMQARVLTHQTMMARPGTPEQERLEEQARETCWLAMRHTPSDPVPYILLLRLASLDNNEYAPKYQYNWEPHPTEMALPPGPWGLLESACDRDPLTREAYHRMLQVLQHRRGSTGSDYCRYLASRHHWNSPDPALLMPLYAYVEECRQLLSSSSVLSTGSIWTKPGPVQYAERARDHWFWATRPEDRSILDLNHLAYALTASGAGKAGPVFEAIGPYATWSPWGELASNRVDWKEEFCRARDVALRLRRPR